MEFPPFLRIPSKVFRGHLLERGIRIEGKGGNPKPFQKKSSFFGYPMLIRAESVCLFFKQPRGSNAMLLPARVIFEFCRSIRSFKW